MGHAIQRQVLKFDIFKDTKTPTLEDAIRSGYVLVIPKLNFPTNKNKIIWQMKELNLLRDKFCSSQKKLSYEKILDTDRRRS